MTVSFSYILNDTDSIIHPILAGIDEDQQEKAVITDLKNIPGNSSGNDYYSLITVLANLFFYAFVGASPVNLPKSTGCLSILASEQFVKNLNVTVPFSIEERMKMLNTIRELFAKNEIRESKTYTRHLVIGQGLIISLVKIVWSQHTNNHSMSVTIKTYDPRIKQRKVKVGEIQSEFARLGL